MLRTGIVGFILCYAPMAVMAQDLGLPVFPQASIERTETVESADTRIFAGAIRDVRGELRASNEIRTELSGEKRMISAGRDYSVSELKAHYEAMLKNREATIIYACDARTCGSSNVWANRVFGESRLYGRDDEQAYRVSAWLDSHNRIQLNTLYIVQRGNRQVYAYEQAFRMPENKTLPGVVVGDRRVFGPVVVSWSDPSDPSVDASEDALRQIMRLTEEFPAARAWLVGFSPMEGSLDQVMAETESAMDVLAGQLRDEGLSGDRIRKKALGPLVPVVAEGRTGRRIEVMIVREGQDD